MVLVVNTTSNNELSEKVSNILGQKELEYEIINTASMNISHCVGCGNCWLKTPGICVFNDDYPGIMQKIIAADQLWVISDTALGFLNYKGKNIFDRILPILCIYLEFRGDQMRHILRYDTRTDIGIIYQGEANRNFMRQWLDRCTDNLDCKSLGAYPVIELKEAAKCMH